MKVCAKSPSAFRDKKGSFENSSFVPAEPALAQVAPIQTAIAITQIDTRLTQLEDEQHLETAQSNHRAAELNLSCATNLAKIWKHLVGREELRTPMSSPRFGLNMAI